MAIDLFGGGTSISIGNGDNRVLVYCLYLQRQPTEIRLCVSNVVLYARYADTLPLS